MGYRSRFSDCMPNRELANDFMAWFRGSYVLSWGCWAHRLYAGAWVEDCPHVVRIHSMYPYAWAEDLPMVFGVQGSPAAVCIGFTWLFKCRRLYPDVRADDVSIQCLDPLHVPVCMGT